MINPFFEIENSLLAWIATFDHGLLNLASITDLCDCVLLTEIMSKMFLLNNYLKFSFNLDTPNILILPK